MLWLDIMVEESVNMMREGWECLVKDYLFWLGELKLRKLWINLVLEMNELMDFWVLFSVYVELFYDSMVRFVMGFIIDILYFKWV